MPKIVKKKKGKLRATCPHGSKLYSRGGKLVWVSEHDDETEKPRDRPARTADDSDDDSDADDSDDGW